MIIMMSNDAWTKEWSIPTEASQGKKVVDEILDTMRTTWGISPDEDQNPHIFSVHLAVEEAVVNAMKHGNQNDQSKTVRVYLLATNTLCRVLVIDEGAGYDPSDVPDPTQGDNLELPSGRGLLLMRSMMHSVLHNDKGNEVTMEYDLSQADDD